MSEHNIDNLNFRYEEHKVLTCWSQHSPSDREW